MQNILQAMDQISGVKHLKTQGGKQRQTFIDRNFSLEKWLALFQEMLLSVLR